MMIKIINWDLRGKLKIKWFFNVCDTDHFGNVKLIHEEWKIPLEIITLKKYKKIQQQNTEKKFLLKTKMKKPKNKIKFH